MSEHTFEISFSSDIYYAKQAVTSIISFIMEHMPGISEEDAGDLRLIFSELLFNAAIHGNHCDAASSVHVRVAVDGYCVNSVITDEGSGFDYAAMISKMGEEADVTSESGRGIRLVYSLADSLAFNLEGNEIKFYKRVALDG